MVLRVLLPGRPSLSLFLALDYVSILGLYRMDLY